MMLKEFYVSSKDTPLTKTPEIPEDADATMILWKFCDRVSCKCPVVNYFKTLGATFYETERSTAYYFNFKPNSTSIDNLRKDIDAARVTCQFCQPLAR